MNFQQLLSLLAHTSSPFKDGVRCINFITSSYRGIWWPLLRKKLSSCHGEAITLLDATHALPRDIIAQLEMPFLGNPLLIMLVAEHDGQVKTLDDRIWKSIQNYQGTHYLVVITPPSQALTEQPTVAVITMPLEIEEAEYRLICQMSGDSSSAAGQDQMARQLFAYTDKVTVEQACALAQYQGLLGRYSAEFCSKWLTQLIPTQRSLFTLAQYLFAHDRTRFYAAWHLVATDYPPEFWLSFWSEQCWQAYLFLLYNQEQGSVVAAKLVKGLPFSFIKRFVNCF